MAIVFQRPHALKEKELHYCAGCPHGTIHRLIAEAMDELQIEGNTISIASVGCSYCSFEYFNCDAIQAPHGRAPAVAAGVKRVHPNNVVFTYQGDGDLAAIGTAEIIHAAARGDKITAFFVNNAIYGMTAGQMAPTTLPGQVTMTSPYGRDVDTQGFPIKVSEMISQLEGAVYVERVAMNTVQNIKKAKQAIKKAFEVQIAGKGFTLVEILSTCPTNWGKNPIDSIKWMEENMLPFYPLGVYKETYKGEA